MDLLITKIMFVNSNTFKFRSSGSYLMESPYTAKMQTIHMYYILVIRKSSTKMRNIYMSQWFATCFSTS